MVFQIKCAGSGIFSCIPTLIVLIAGPDMFLHLVHESLDMPGIFCQGEQALLRKTMIFMREQVTRLRSAVRFFRVFPIRYTTGISPAPWRELLDCGQE